MTAQIHRAPRLLQAERSVSILGATGSIGTTTLNLIRRYPDAYPVIALTAHSNVAELAALAVEFRARFAAIGDPSLYEELKQALAGHGIACGAGSSGLDDAAAMDAEWTMAAITGIAGLGPALQAVRRGRCVALANKESLVAAGFLMMREVEAHGTTLLPVDSEHNAVFQLIHDRAEKPRKIILTASGGPFLRYDEARLREATPEDAVKHPNWSMGAKISVDSATLMNKGLELIEAQHLFAMPPEALDVVIHPESIVHCLVHHKDGAILAQMSAPDMTTPIAHALGWPKRLDTGRPPFDLTTLGALHFEAPDRARFPCLDLACRAMRQGGAAPIVLNAANEIAVERFLHREIGFCRIAAIVGTALDGAEDHQPCSLEEVLEIDHTTRQRLISESTRR